jgi:hypothetical protein
MERLWHCSLCAADVPRAELDDASRCGKCQKRSAALSARRAERLLEANPRWPQPADPFADLPPAKRATCDRDHLS